MARDSLAQLVFRCVSVMGAACALVGLTGCGTLPSSALRAIPAVSPLGDDSSVIGPQQTVRRPPNATVRGQDPGPTPNAAMPGSHSNHWRYPMAVSGGPVSGSSAPVASGRQAAFAQPSGAQPTPYQTVQYQPGAPTLQQSPQYFAAPGTAPPGSYAAPPKAYYQQPGPGAPAGVFPEFTPGPNYLPPVGGDLVEPGIPIPLDVYVEEERTGKFMFGAAVNSDLGVTGQIVVDERNFDIFRPPTSFDDILNGTAWRGRGQGFRLEAMPGSAVQRYTVQFTEPYLLDTDVSMNASAFYLDRRYQDWDEHRQGGRLAFGYRLTPDLSISSAIRAEEVEIEDPRVLTVPELNEVLGKNDLYSGRVTLTHDTRDIPFATTEGHFFQASYEQTFGDFDYPRGEIDYKRYFLVTERPDGSGRHTLSYSFNLGFSGSQTPIFENFFAGGYATMRGFDFRGASPVKNGVAVGGEFQFLGSVEYLFPLTADDMIKGVVFVDYGTVEENIEIQPENYRVAPGFGVRIAVPALGPAPLAFDLAFPVAKADFDDVENFSFFFGFGRN